MRHVFIALKMGWKGEREVIWFDSYLYTLEQARAQFKAFRGVTQRGYDYTGYEFAGEKYHDYQYLGEFEDEDMPQN